MFSAIKTKAQRSFFINRIDNLAVMQSIEGENSKVLQK